MSNAMTISREVCLWAVICVGAGSASAAQPVAIVEDVKSQVAGLEDMDYLTKGATFRLAPDDAVVIGYLESCVREAIRGGRIEIGETQSKVESGVVERAKIECDAGRMVGAPGVALESTGFITRGLALGVESPMSGAPLAGPSPPTEPLAQKPEFTLYGASPLIELKGAAGLLVIVRLDRKGESFRWDIDPLKLSRGRFLDLAMEGLALAPGGVYEGRWQNHLVVFNVDRAARPGWTPLLGRLLRLGFSP
jgi:hypothetical protein